MPSIYLKQTQSTYTTGSVSVSSGKPYQPSKLFKSFKHTFTSPSTNENIWVYNGKFDWSGYFTITRGSTHGSAKLKEAHVYYNQHDTEKTPLVLAFVFENGGAGVDNKYYTRTQFKSKFTGTQTEDINTLTTYTNDQGILEDLITENDQLTEPLTYNIGKIKGDDNGGGGNGQYNGGKIKVEDDTSGGEPKLSGTGFNRYKHTPATGNTGKKACVIYDKNVLLKSDKGELPKIQGQVYTSIVVYMGSKAKKKSASNGAGLLDVPLLIELTKQYPPNNPEYYVHKRNPSGGREYYWEKLPGDSPGTTLKELLEDMGFGIKNGDNGYNELRGLLTKADVSVSDGAELSQKLNGLKGSQLKSLLSQTVPPSDGDGVSTGSSPKSFLELLLTQIEFDLLDSVVILLDKNGTGGSSSYNDSEVGGVVRQVQPPRTINRVNMSGGNKISLTDATDQNGLCVQPYSYKLIKHDFSGLVTSFGGHDQSQVAIRFIIQSESSATEYHQLKLYSNDKPDPQNLQYTYYKPRDTDVYVYYYQGDPRPLLVCYGENAYKPRKTAEPIKERQVMVEYSTWEKVTTIRECTCSGAGTGGTNKQILDALHEVTGFLNPVQINPKQIPTSASETITAGTGGKADYNLHTYLPRTKIKMGISRTKVDCYNKYTYQPYGTKGSFDNTFRLGNVLHTNSRYSSTRSTLKYTTDSPSNKYHPVVGVTVYYYDEDKGYDDPLLIELEFKTNGGAGSGAKEYYKLTQTGDGSGGDGNLKWEKDTGASSAIGAGGGAGNQKLIAHLDSIRHSLKKVIKIYIDKQQTYGLCLSTNPGGSAATYGPAPGGSNKIEVNEYEENGCSELAAKNYKCYVHKVSTISTGDGFDYNTIGGLKFYISGKQGNGSDDVEIPLYKDNGGSRQLEPITYNKCMGDVYVFFYCQPNCPGPGPSSSKPVTAPLMLYYNKGYYRPKDIDQYFKKWVCESALPPASSDKPCGGVTGGATTELATQLDKVNRDLNRINLGPSTVSGLSGGGSASSTYGIPKPTTPASTEPQIVLDRIQVTMIPTTGPPATRPYCKLVHRTVNGFTIGDIYYWSNDITKGGVKINGSGTGGSISVGSPNHTTNFVNPPGGSNTPNTVVAYYHTGDGGYKLPQLIVLMETTDEISPDQTITATPSTKYGYYVLATNGGTGGGNTYKYEWRTVDDVKPDPFKLNDQTEFSLLNSVVVLVDQQKQYEESDISGAVKNLQNKSPGNLNGVNRLKNRDITLKDESSTGKGKCVSTYGYKLFEHSLSSVTAPIFSIQPILGLRFLIPSSTKAEGSYDEISLYPTDNTDTEPVGPLYHTSSIDKVYVYFYGSDPRPLLLCFGTDAYIPKKTGEPTPEKQVNVDYTKWTKVDGITKCVCENNAADNSNKVLDTLLNVVLFLNPVQLNPTQIPRDARSQITGDSPKPPTPKDTTYELHKFTAIQTVKMKITRENVECYEKYIYQPYGTNNYGTGFRLGNVIYDSGTSGSKPKGTLEYTTKGQYKHHSLVKVAVYYYDHDKEYSDPLLIELDFNVNWYVETTHEKEYWKLTKNDGTAGNGMEWKLDPHGKEQIGYGINTRKIVTYLDSIRYHFKKVLEICIAIKQNKTYQAKLLNRENGSAVEPQEQIQVPVTEENNCPSIKDTGFRCFKHAIKTLAPADLHKFAALKFMIPGRNSTNLVKLNLYDTPPKGLLNQLYYNCGMGDIYVYFYGTGTSTNGGSDQNDGDPRPLLLCYNNNQYRATTITSYDTQKWIKPKSLDDCSNPLKGLIRVCNFLNPVWINKTSENSYVIHKFDGKEISIKVESTLSQNGFCYHKYTHIHNGIGDGGTGFRLGNIEYYKKCIQDDSKSFYCINSLTKKSPTYDPASEVVVYYYKGDKTYQNPLLIALKNNGETYNPYYEIQRSSTKTDKQYKKESNNLSLETSKGGQLEKILDRILYYISNSLQINLGFRARTEVQYPGKIGEKIPTIKHDKYQATVYENESSNKFKKTTETVQVEVSETIDIKTTSGNETGYQCYQHKLTSVKNINNIGGLRLFLWDNRGPEEDNDEKDCKITRPNPLTKPKCCELDLHGENSQPVQPIAYTTCKGDLYVYFYGSDPRPMLLCYNGGAYVPQNLETYSQKWCRVSTITSCECSDKGLADPAQLLQQLYQISMFLNPVNLWETLKAHEKV